MPKHSGHQGPEMGRIMAQSRSYVNIGLGRAPRLEGERQGFIDQEFGFLF